MVRPAKLIIEPSALLHNLAKIQEYAPGKKVIAMVKANAYGCGVDKVAPVLDGRIAAFGVACLDEAIALRAMGCRTPCLLFQGFFSVEELLIAARHQFSCVLHKSDQLSWLLNTPLKKPIKIWVKVNTGMHRLGFQPHELPDVMSALKGCAWVDPAIGLMTHLACADEPSRLENINQLATFAGIEVDGFSERSIANSAAIMAFPQTHADAIRPGIMLYGVSPFAQQIGIDLGLIPAMRFLSAITAIHHNPPGAAVGYGGVWKSDTPTTIGIVAAGYGDGYPRTITPNTPVWVKGQEVPIVGRVSMDMLTVNLTNHSDVQLGDSVELWGRHIAVERIAQSAGTIAYELLCKMTERIRQK